MDYRIIWTEKASDDIKAIIRQIRRHNPQAAVQIGCGIFDKVQILLKFPEAGSVLEELGSPNIRKLIFRNWKIVYQQYPADKIIAVLRVWHAARGEVEI